MDLETYTHPRHGINHDSTVKLKCVLTRTTESARLGGAVKHVLVTVSFIPSGTQVWGIHVHSLLARWTKVRLPPTWSRFNPWNSIACRIVSMILLPAQCCALWVWSYHPHWANLTSVRTCCWVGSTTRINMIGVEASVQYYWTHPKSI